MAATVKALLPLSDGLVEALARARLTTAGRLASYFGSSAGDVEAVEMQLVRALGSEVPGALELSVWVDELMDYLPGAEDEGSPAR